MTKGCNSQAYGGAVPLLTARSEADPPCSGVLTADQLTAAKPGCGPGSIRARERRVAVVVLTSAVVDAGALVGCRAVVVSAVAVDVVDEESSEWSIVPDTAGPELVDEMAAVRRRMVEDLLELSSVVDQLARGR